jgi:hypothetical protein
MLKYTKKTQNTYIQSWTVTEIMAIEMCAAMRYGNTVTLASASSFVHCSQRMLARMSQDIRSAAACVKYLEV